MPGGGVALHRRAGVLVCASKANHSARACMSHNSAMAKPLLALFISSGGRMAVGGSTLKAIKVRPESAAEQ